MRAFLHGKVHDCSIALLFMILDIYFSQWTGQNAAGWDQAAMGAWSQANWGNPAAAAAAAAGGAAGWNAAAAAAGWDASQAAGWGAAAGGQQQGNYGAYAGAAGTTDYGRTAVSQHSYHPYKRQ